MVYIAQRYIEDKGNNAQALNAYFNDTVTATDTTYTVEHLVKQGDGTYKLYGEAQKENAKVNAKVTATAKTNIPHYTYEKGDLSGVVYANDKRTFKLYYTFAVPEDEKVANKGLVESTATHVLSTGFISGLNLKLYKVLGSTETEVKNFAFESNGDIDITKLSGTYVARACAGEEVIQTVTFDAYSKNDKFEYNEDYSYATCSVVNASYATVEQTVVSQAQGRTGSYIKTAYTPVEGSGDADYAASYIKLPLAHSKAYYEMYDGHYFTFDYYIDATESGETIASNTYSLIRLPGGLVEINNYASAIEYHAQTNVGAWYTAKRPMSYIIENYDDLQSGAKYMVGFCNYLTTKQNVKLSVYTGNQAVEFVATADSVQKAVEKSAATSLDVATFMSDENKVLANKFPGNFTVTLKDNSGETKSVAGTVVDLSALSTGAYIIDVKLGSTALLNGSVYIYENGETLIWNTIGLNEKNAYGDYFCNEGKRNDLGNISMVTVETLSEDNAVGGKKSGSFYKMDTKSSPEHDFHFVLRPIFEKSVYSAYLEQHANAKLVFDVFVAPADGFVHNDRLYTINGQSGNEQFAVNTWHTLETSLSTLVTNYDSLYTRSNENKSWIFGIAGSYLNETNVLTVYIGNFRIESGD